MNGRKGGDPDRTSLSWAVLRQRMATLLARLQARSRLYSKQSRAFFHAGPAQRLIMYTILILMVVVGFIGYGARMSAWASEVVTNAANCLRHPRTCIFPPTEPPPVPEGTPTPTPQPALTPMPMPRHLPEAVDKKVQSWTQSEKLRHYLVLGLTIWFAYRLAAVYFGDLHHIGDFRFAAHLFRRTILARAYGMIVVKGGRVTSQEKKDRAKKGVEKKSHDLVRLLEAGVPAKVLVASDSCLVVEILKGEPVVIGPTGRQPGLLRSFSRIRRVVDLREQTARLTVQGWTRDGLPITAKDVALRFSVARNGQSPTQRQPYPYDEQAMLNLVYRYWLDGQATSRRPAEGQSEFHSAMVERIEVELREFIGQCTMDEIMPFVAVAAGQPSPDSTGNPLAVFVQSFNAQALERGIELAWQGEGEWVLPPEVNLEGQKAALGGKRPVLMLDDWQCSVNNWLRRAAMQRGEMDDAARIRRARDLQELVRQVPISVKPPPARPGGDPRPYQIMRALARAYRDKLNEALEVYQQEGEAPPQELIEVIERLNQLI